MTKNLFLRQQKMCIRDSWCSAVCPLGFFFGLMGKLRAKLGFGVRPQANCATSVSYTHLDVYKRQAYIDASPHACFTRGQKVEFSINTSGISQAFTIMMALAGNFDSKGGQNIGREPATGYD